MGVKHRRIAVKPWCLAACSKGVVKQRGFTPADDQLPAFMRDAHQTVAPQPSRQERDGHWDMNETCVEVALQVATHVPCRAYDDRSD